MEGAPERWHAAWSQDGKAIFYLRDEDGLGCQIRKRDVESGAEEVLYRAPEHSAHLLEPVLSPDGRWLAFGAGKQGHTYAESILIMPASGGTPRELLKLEEPAWTYSIEWTRDGRHVLFGRRVNNAVVPSEVWRLSVEGGEPENLGLPLWARGGMSLHPDGRRLAYSHRIRTAEIWVLENFWSLLQGTK